MTRTRFLDATKDFMWLFDYELSHVPIVGEDITICRQGKQKFYRVVHRNWIIYEDDSLYASLSVKEMDLR